MNRRAFLAAAAASSFATAAHAQAPPPAFRSRFAGAISYSADRDGAALVVARNGVILTEDYPGGPRDGRWRIGAGTRAFAPLLAASMVRDRLMTLDEPASMTLTEWSLDPAKSLIPIRALLTGTSGFAFDRRGPQDAATALALQPVATLGQRYIDDSASYVLLTELAKRKLLGVGRNNGDAAAYLTERTLSAIGCVPIGWTRAPDGSPRFDDGVAVSARGWAQAGELIRRDGVWRAGQLVDDQVMREARLGTFAETHAGMGLYLAGDGRTREPPTNSDLWRMNPLAPSDLVMAAGQGGQRLYILTSRNVVIARMARTPDPHDWSDATFLSLVLRDL